MNTARQIANRLLNEIPNESLNDVIPYLAFIKNKKISELSRELIEASLSGTDFGNKPSEENSLLSLFDTFGAWEDSKDAETIIKEIEGSRTSRKADVIL